MNVWRYNSFLQGNYQEESHLQVILAMFFVYLVCPAGILWALSLSDFLDIYPHFEPWVQVILIRDHDEQRVLKIL